MAPMSGCSTSHASVRSPDGAQRNPGQSRGEPLLLTLSPCGGRVPDCGGRVPERGEAERRRVRGPFRRRFPLTRLVLAVARHPLPQGERVTEYALAIFLKITP
jgi:hypothetical protein